MTYVWPQGDPITVQTDPAGQPRALRWRGVEHAVEQVLDRWRVNTGWWDDAPVSREYFTLTTTSGLLLTIFRDLASHEWKLQQVYG